MSWIKVETHTPEKPEVFAIADQLGISSDDAFGKCFRVWAWFDAHTTNGKTNGSGVSASLLNRVAGVSGFAESMVSVGWLVSDESGLTVSNFDKHNGETAKQRGLTAKRVAKHSIKTNDKTNGASVKDALAREDKIREDLKDIPAGASISKPKSSKPKTYPIPTDFGISESVQKWAEVKGHTHLAERLEHFVGWAKAGGKVYADWDQTFMNAIRGDWAELGKPVPSSNSNMTLAEKHMAFARRQAGLSA